MPKRKQPSSNSQPVWLWGGIGVVVVVILALAVWYRGDHGASSSTRAVSNVQAGLPIDGIQCNSMEQAVFHIHSHLTLYIRGEQHIVPQLIGISLKSNCLYWLHTHDTSGVVHVESPKQGTYTLGQFFDIWNQPLDGTHLISAVAKSGEQVKAWVNDKPWTGDIRDIPLKDHELIAVELGPPWPTPETSFDFSPYDAP